jgi:hypothetical protein
VARAGLELGLVHHEGPSASLDEALASPFPKPALRPGALEARLHARDRVALLSEIAETLGEGGSLSLDVPVAEGAPALGRLLLDVPRRLAPEGWLPPPGTRFYAGAARHVYFTLTELEREAARAGFVVSVEPSGRLVLTRSAAPVTLPPPRATIAEVLFALGLAEALRHASPARAFRLARDVGRRGAARSSGERRALHARIAGLDGLVPPGPNCLRRVLAETLLDRGAASDTVVLSLDVGRTGHAHFLSDPRGAPRPYEVAFEV